MASRNSFERLVQQCVAVFGLVTGNATTPTISNQTGDIIADKGNVSISRTSTGVYAMSITSFRGQKTTSSNVNVMVTPVTAGDNISVGTPAYTASTDTLVITFTIQNASASAVDDSFYFQVYAF